MMVELDDGLRDVLERLKAGQDLGSAVLNDVIAYLEREGWQSLGPNDERSRLYGPLAPKPPDYAAVRHLPAIRLHENFHSRRQNNLVIGRRAATGGLPPYRSFGEKFYY